ncbi:putative membrane protein [Clostridium butyricum]|nr:putative membrane protein [Clostridium butyricum]
MVAEIFELTKALGGLIFKIVKLGVVIVGIITILKH